MSSFKENLVFFAQALGALFTCLCLLFFITSSVSRYECASYGEITGLQVKFAITKCYVNSGGKYIPYSEYVNKDVGNKIIVK